MALFWEMALCWGRAASVAVAARAVVGVGRAATASGRIANFWRVFGAFVSLFIEFTSAGTYAQGQQVACFALLLLLKNLGRAIPVLLSPLTTSSLCAVRADDQHAVAATA